MNISKLRKIIEYIWINSFFSNLQVVVTCKTILVENLFSDRDTVKIKYKNGYLRLFLDQVIRIQQYIGHKFHILLNANLISILIFYIVIIHYFLIQSLHLIAS